MADRKDRPHPPCSVPRPIRDMAATCRAGRRSCGTTFAERPSGATAATPDSMKDEDPTGGCSLARLVRRFWCRIVGHKWDEDAITYACMAYCLRCHYEQECGPSEPWTLANWLWWRKQKLSSWYWRLRGRIRQWRNQPPDDIPFSSPNDQVERQPPPPTR